MTEQRAEGREQGAEDREQRAERSREQRITAPQSVASLAAAAANCFFVFGFSSSAEEGLVA
jgi:hypothetical protein